MKNCVYCEQEFLPKSKNQKYCCQECCRKATNKKIMQKYYENKERLNGKVRLCIECNFKISRYVAGNICTICEQRKRKNNPDMIKEAMKAVLKQVK